MVLDIAKARRETPGCEQVLHFNNAGAALMPKCVIDAVNQHFHLEAMRGGYEAAALQESKIKEFYALAGQLIGAGPNEIAYIENATRAWDMAFYSLDFKPGDKILTAYAEYASNYLAFMQVAKKTGAVIEVIDNDETGQLSINDLERRLDKRVKLIAITYVPTQGGLINPAEAVGKIARAANVFYLLDATQAVGQFPVDVQAIGCDALCATGRKYLRGPRGTGFLFVKQSRIHSMEPPFIDLHAARWINDKEYQLQANATRFETWETNYSNKLGLAAAIKYALELGVDKIWKRIHYLAERLRKNLSSIPGLALQDLGEKKCGFVTFTYSKMALQDLQAKLFAKNINVSISLAEYAFLDMHQRGLKSLVRASVHYYNTEEEIERFCSAVESLGRSQLS